MMTKILIDEAVVRQALEYLQDNQHLIADNERHAYVMEYNAFVERFEQTIAEAKKQPASGIKQVIELYDSTEQPAQQEPDPDELTIAYMSGVYEGKKRKPWVGLTDEEIDDIEATWEATQEWVSFSHATRVIEAKLKEKNTKGGA